MAAAQCARSPVIATVISAPREEIFDFVSDLAARPAYSDHFMRDYRLARANPVGLGAAARFQLHAPLGKETPSCRSPRSTARAGSSRRRGRPARPQPLVAVYDFSLEGHGVTRVELTTLSEPATLVDRFKQPAPTAGSGARPARRWSACA